ncbi:NlpC/P60 family protein [Streptomyces sp. MTZ3.1]|uniref:NlpC/P60 family protein n=1 Tax=Streptomyces meridianus TaxID=2938945 RepID=A0ABT0X4Z7_9ACTN|nr:C40 family peptidase [Streptomyces meridianus]MCM2577616.1 NlpC/P60 family protein [Streptomyces meridianus]
MSGTCRTAVGLTSAALATVTLIGNNASAAPEAPQRPSLRDVQKKVDKLYREAGAATQKYNAAKERTREQRAEVDKLLDEVARRTDKVNTARRTLGEYAAAQYRSGGLASTATLMLAENPQGYFDQTHLMGRMTERQQHAVREYRDQQQEASVKRGQASASLSRLTDAQEKLRTSKQTVRTKLTEARETLAKLTAEEKARLAAIERKKRAEAKRKAAELERQQAQQSGSAGGSYSAQAEKAIAFARAQIGKPYVWGATGPSSYDCSGLTQAAWKAAGISLPRTTWDQVKVGTRVATSDLEPGDLVFFYSDISHVGLYIGNGQMIHAPKPGADVRTESITYMPIYGSVRPS